MHGIPEFDGLLQPRQAVGCERIHLAGPGLVATVLDDRTVALRVVAVVSHIAADIRDNQIDGAAPVNLDLLGGNRLDVFAMKPARVGMHVCEHGRLVDLEHARVGHRHRRLGRLPRAGGKQQKCGSEQAGL